MLMAERIDRVEARCRRAGKEAKDDTHRGREHEGQRDDAVVEGKWKRERSRYRERGGQRQRDADRAPEQRQHDGFDQELGQHIAFEGTDRQPDADLARAFCYRHQHDVHDADAANEQADRRYCRQQGRQRARRAGDRVGDLLLVHDAEVVVGIAREAAALAHQASDVLLRLFGGHGVADRELDLPDVVVPAQPALHRAQRDDDGVVAVLSEVALAFRFEQSDHGARQRTQAETTADRILR
jgi:hypothetical protein